MRKIWTPEEDAFMRENYPDNSAEYIAKTLNRSVSSVYGRSQFLGLTKSDEYVLFLKKKSAENLTRAGANSRFQKGHSPANKGMKMPDEVYQKVKSTMFKKGNIPGNHKPVGYERITRDGYIEMKIAEPNVFRLKHRIIWEKKYGEIPSGHNVQFRDGNPLNIDINNLYLISRSEQMKTENSYHANYPEEVKKLIQIKGALQRQINKRKKDE